MIANDDLSIVFIKSVMYNNINAFAGETYLEGLVMFDLNILLKNVVYKVKCLKIMSVFLSIDSLKGYEWNYIPESEYRLFNTVLLNKIDSVNLETVIAAKILFHQQKCQFFGGNSYA